MKRRQLTSPLKFALSATLALALSVAPVSAGSNNSNSDNQDIATIIGALLGLATIGVILSNNNDRDKQLQGAHNQRPQQYRPQHHRPHKQVQKQRVPKHLRLPKDCFRTYRTQEGKRDFFSNRCLNRNFAYSSKLPRACKDTIVARNNQGTYVARKIYRPRCLNKSGYRLSRFY